MPSATAGRPPGLRWTRRSAATTRRPSRRHSKRSRATAWSSAIRPNRTSRDFRSADDRAGVAPCVRLGAAPSRLGYAWETMTTTGGSGLALLPAEDPELFTLNLRGLRRRWADAAARSPITAEAMRGADWRAQALGVPGERLMEHAGTAVAAAVKAIAEDQERWGRGPILILAGPGNN